MVPVRTFLLIILPLWLIPLSAGSVCLFGYLSSASEVFTEIGYRVLLPSAVLLIFGIVMSVWYYRRAANNYQRGAALLCIGLLLTNIPVGAWYAFIGFEHYDGKVLLDIRNNSPGSLEIQVATTIDTIDVSLDKMRKWEKWVLCTASDCMLSVKLRGKPTGNEITLTKDLGDVWSKRRIRVLIDENMKMSVMP